MKLWSTVFLVLLLIPAHLGEEQATQRRQRHQREQHQQQRQQQQGQTRGQERGERCRSGIRLSGAPLGSRVRLEAYPLAGDVRRAQER